MDITKELKLGRSETTTVYSSEPLSPALTLLFWDYFLNTHSYNEYGFEFYGAEVTQERLDQVVSDIEEWVEQGCAKYVDYDDATQKISHVVIEDGNVYDIQWNQETKKPFYIQIKPQGHISLTVEHNVYQGHDTWNDSKYYV